MIRFAIVLKPDAVEDLDRLRRYDATTITDAMERPLCAEPTRETRSRIRRLRGRQKADYRLRVGSYRVFYCVQENTVWILRVLHKRETTTFYEEEGS